VANKGGVREEGAAGWLLAMAREMGGGTVRRSRGAEDGGAWPACLREEDEGGARTSMREQRGRPGGPTRGRGEVGRGWVKNRRWAKIQKEILFKFQLILEIWQKFAKLHKEI
jgi:hypothetical protein